MIVVYTALFGDVTRDQLQPPACNVPHVCFTDHPSFRVSGWAMRRLPPGPPVMAARMIKTRPDLWFTPDATTIWHDASCRLRQSAADIVAAMTAPIMALLHPDRATIEEEADVLIQWSMAAEHEVRRQVSTYRAHGFHVERGLTTTGFMVRTPAAHAFNVLWQSQLTEHTLRDQLSVDYCAWKTQTPIGYFPGHYRANAQMEYRRHKRAA